QKQCRLQQPRQLICPQNAPVKSVEFAGVVQGVESERYQAEDVKMRGTHRRLYTAAIDADNLVLAPDPRPLGRTVRLQSIRHQVAVPLHPPGAIIRNRNLVFALVVETRE